MMLRIPPSALRAATRKASRRSHATNRLVKSAISSGRCGRAAITTCTINIGSSHQQHSQVVAIASSIGGAPQQQVRSLHLSPRETDHLHLHSAGRLAQYRLARGLRLNVPEAIALIAMQMMEMVRNGAVPTVTTANGDTVVREGSVSDLMSVGTQLLGRNQVLPGVASMVREVQVEATFPDGTKLLTVHDPIGKEDGNLALALEGSFLPLPDLSVFHSGDNTVEEEDVTLPGQVMVSPSMPSIEINPTSDLIEMSVTNTGDRPIQVGSHYRELLYLPICKLCILFTRSRLY